MQTLTGQTSFFLALSSFSFQACPGEEVWGLGSAVGGMHLTATRWDPEPLLPGAKASLPGAAPPSSAAGKEKPQPQPGADPASSRRVPRMLRRCAEGSPSPRSRDKAHPRGDSALGRCSSPTALCRCGNGWRDGAPRAGLHAGEQAELGLEPRSFLFVTPIPSSNPRINSGPLLLCCGTESQASSGESWCCGEGLGPRDTGELGGSGASPFLEAPWGSGTKDLQMSSKELCAARPCRPLSQRSPVPQRRAPARCLWRLRASSPGICSKPGPALRAEHRDTKTRPLSLGMLRPVRR